MDTLTQVQKDVLEQLQALTNGGDTDVAIGVLQSVDWDIQRATDIIFDAPSTTVEKSTSRRMEMFEVDDTEQGSWSSAHARNASPAYPLLPSRPNSLFSILTYPFHVLSSLLRFVFGILRIPFPNVRFATLNFLRPFGSSPTRPSDPRSVADRWVRMLEEETGAVCVSRARYQPDASASGADPGPSSLAHRATATAQHIDGVGGDGRRLLPDFTLSSYEEVLRKCQNEARVGCIVLVSEEHDDTGPFKRDTLTDPALVKILTENEFIVWGADVRDREGWSAAQKLQATTYPFVAFLALQPRRGSSAASSSSTLTVLSRHQGPSIPASGADLGPTSARALAEHLERQVLPRVTPFLGRIKATNRERERERQLREEQDRAFQDSARRDRERIEARMAAERQEQEEAVAREREVAGARERQAREEAMRKEAADTRMKWRRWARRTLVKPEPTNTRDTLRVGIRLPDGSRIVRHFASDDTLTALYAFIDSQFIPNEIATDDDPRTSPGGLHGDASIEQQIASSGRPSQQWWGFKLASVYPRHEITWKAATPLASVEGVKGGGQLVVEIISSGREDSRGSGPSGVARDDDDDGYDTEESDS